MKMLHLRSSTPVWTYGASHDGCIRRCCRSASSALPRGWRKSGRGMGLARVSAARRGVKLARTRRVAEHRRAWQWAQASSWTIPGWMFLSRMRARLATMVQTQAVWGSLCGLVPGWRCCGIFGSSISERHNGARVHALVQTYRTYRAAIAFRSVTLIRLGHAVAFGSVVWVLGQMLPYIAACVLAYGVVHLAATRSSRAHGHNCRVFTVTAAASVAWLGLGPDGITRFLIYFECVQKVSAVD